MDINGGGMGDYVIMINYSGESLFTELSNSLEFSTAHSTYLVRTQNF